MPIRRRRHAQADALAGKAVALPVQRLMLTEFAERIIASRFGPAKPRGVTWNGAGGWVMVSQAGQENRSRRQRLFVIADDRLTGSLMSVEVTPLQRCWPVDQVVLISTDVCSPVVDKAAAAPRKPASSAVMT
jgi:hypothetical protein